MRPLDTPPARVWNKALWAGRILSAIPVLMLLVSGAMKVVKPAFVVEGFTTLGWPEQYTLGLGLLELACTAVYQRILFQCLEKEPARRPESARSLHDALDACESAGQWTEERARDWWLEHERQVKMVGAGKALSATALSPRSQVTATVLEPLRV